MRENQNVRCASNEYLYITKDGKIHAEGTLLPISFYTVSSIFRDTFLVLMVIKIVSYAVCKKMN